MSEQNHSLALSTSVVKSQQDMWRTLGHSADIKTHTYNKKGKTYTIGKSDA